MEESKRLNDVITSLEAEVEKKKALIKDLNDSLRTRNWLGKKMAISSIKNLQLRIDNIEIAKNQSLLLSEGLKNKISFYQTKLTDIDVFLNKFILHSQTDE